MAKFAIHLGKAERFQFAGQRISRVTIDGKWAVLYSWRGYVGCVEPDNVPAVHNILEARKHYIRYDEAQGAYVRL